MYLTKLYIRFFRSLNFDYLRKAHTNYKPDLWDTTPNGSLYPFVRVSLERDITTVVGANESGKSQLLEAIKLGLTGDNIRRGDFCRYSRFFSGDSELTLPEFGIQFPIQGTSQRELVATLCEIDECPATVDSGALFRMNEAPRVRFYLRDGNSWTMHPIKKPTSLKSLGLPSYFEIDAATPLPDAVPLGYLVDGKLDSGERQAVLRRAWDRISEHAESWFSSADAVRSSADDIVAALENNGEVDETTIKKYRLADDLLTKVAGLDRGLFVELQNAIADKRNGYANSIVDTINSELSKSLNFPHWWSQDSAFKLVVDLRQDELVFVIHDRTGTSYSFDERSAGLKYFLSYFVQYLSHEPPPDGQSEILLMDEPDAFLSSSGQQDLLRIFSAFAKPDSVTRRPIQVVYVTHSPFLIDKNHAERIRVLEKGENDEGTRIVANASRNHYEPLRSALGGFVGETTFIGTCNLLLEGPADQIFIAGISSLLARDEASSSAKRLDLNTITLVPAGSASHVPYLAFLARGRDVDRPPVIVLLDGDAEGKQARQVLLRGGPHSRQLISEDYILQIGDPALEGIRSSNPAGAREIEDLIPFELVVLGVRKYCKEFVPGVDLQEFNPELEEVYVDGCGTHKGIERAIGEYSDSQEFHLDKIGFARSVVAVSSEASGCGAVTVLKANFEVLLGELAKRQRGANRDASSERIRSRINRVRKRFAIDHPQAARREDVLLLIEEIGGQLDNSVEAEEVRATMRSWVREFSLEDSPRDAMDNYQEFLGRLEGLPYAGTQAVQDPLFAQNHDDAVGSIAPSVTVEADEGGQRAPTEPAEDSTGEQITPAEDGSTGEAASGGTPRDGAEARQDSPAEASPAESPTPEVSPQ